MPVGGEDKHKDFSLENLIDHPVFLGDFSAPSALRLALQRLGMPQTRLGMHLQFLDEALGLGEGIQLYCCHNPNTFDFWGKDTNKQAIKQIICDLIKII